MRKEPPSPPESASTRTPASSLAIGGRWSILRSKKSGRSDHWRARDWGQAHSQAARQTLSLPTSPYPTAPRVCFCRTPSSPVSMPSHPGNYPHKPILQDSEKWWHPPSLTTLDLVAESGSVWLHSHTFAQWSTLLKVRVRDIGKIGKVPSVQNSELICSWDPAVPNNFEG